MLSVEIGLSHKDMGTVCRWERFFESGKRKASLEKIEYNRNIYKDK